VEILSSASVGEGLLHQLLQQAHRIGAEALRREEFNDVEPPYAAVIFGKT
jgi:hypothetical protein